MVVQLSWLSSRALAAQARGVLGSTPGGCQPLFHFPLFAPHNIQIHCSLRQDALNNALLGVGLGLGFELENKERSKEDQRH